MCWRKKQGQICPKKYKSSRKEKKCQNLLSSEIYLSDSNYFWIYRDVELSMVNKHFQICYSPTKFSAAGPEVD